MVYRLSKSLKGHEKDVRGVTIAYDSEQFPQIVSCSRDGTTRVWNHLDRSNVIVFESSTNSFINAVCHLENDLIASGGKDNIVFINSIKETSADMGIHNLIGHQNNICSLSKLGNLLITSSWDGTAKVWDLNSYETRWTLRSKEGMSVLDAIIVSQDQYLTCSADKTIKLWHKDQEVKLFEGHTDVVRKLVLLSDDKFASASNDGTIKIWSLNGQLLSTLVGHESFIYDLILLPNGLLASAGEDRSVRIWRDLSTLQQTITLPCISNWCLTNIENDIVVGSSDSTIRIFTANPENIADKEELEEFEESVKNSAIAEQSVDINKTDVPGYERLAQPGNEGQTVMVKNNVGVVEAHQWSNGEWNKIGEVVGSSASANKKAYKGKEYDYVFDVDIEDGKPPLKLPFNAGDNVYTVANKFLADNELPSSYVQEVVNFLEKNTQGVSLSEGSSTSNPVPEAIPSLGPELKVIPVKLLIFFKEVNNTQLNKGLTKFSGLQENKLAEIPTKFDVSSAESVSMIKNIVTEVFEWDESLYLIGFDILRVLIRNITVSDILNDAELPELILSFIKKGLTSSNPSVLMMFMKFLNNLTDSVLFVQIFNTTDGSKLEFTSELVDLLKSLSNKTPDSSHKHYSQYAIGYSTFLYNLSAIQITKKIQSKEVANYIHDTNIEEANYRMLIALGNLKYIKLTSIPLPEWAKKHTEPRFTALFTDFKHLDSN